MKRWRAIRFLTFQSAAAYSNICSLIAEKYSILLLSLHVLL